MKTRKKSINELVSQLNKFRGTNLFMQAYFAYMRTFEVRFKFAPHSKECRIFVEKYGKDYKL